MASVISKTHDNGLEYIDIHSAKCRARIFKQGAQITFFQPQDQKPLLWCSEDNDYQVGHAIRGGIPICWPWFGMHPNKQWPQHGFARTQIWQLSEVNIDEQEVDLLFSLPIEAAQKIYWPHNTSLTVRFQLSDSLKVSLINTNLSNKSVSLTQALHSYFPIGDIEQLHATGFEGAQYIEFEQGPYDQVQDSVGISQETDRIYTQLGPRQLLHTPDGIIAVSREHSRSAVLWNPWQEKSSRLSRFKNDDYLSMLCLEAANVRDDQVILAPHSSHTLSTHIQWQA